MRILRWCLLSCLLFPGAAPAAGNISLGGYYKTYLVLFRPAYSPAGPGSGTERPVLGQAANRLRMQFSLKPVKWLDAEVAYDMVPRFQSAGLDQNRLFFSGIDPFAYRFHDLKSTLYPADGGPVDHFALQQNLDRASLTFHTRPADIVVGRQAIAWGSARVINPTDVLAPFTFETLDNEDRIGVDAVRVRIPLGALSELDTGYVFGKDFKKADSAFFCRTKFNLRRTDVSLLFLGFRENVLAGFDLARSIGGAGVWIEAAYVFSDALNDEVPGRQNDYLRASAGMDFSFTPKLYAFAEYHFNGAGTSDPAGYIGNLAKPAYRRGAVYLMGRHYLAPGISYQLTPLIALTAQALANVADPSLFLAPQIEYNAATNLYVGAGSFLGRGQRPTARAGALGSEFGAYPDIFFASLRWYFH